MTTITGGSITADVAFAATYFANLEEQLSDLTPVMYSIGQALETRISGRFETQTDPGGGAWSPWASSTKATYPANGHGKLLDRYGDMLRSLTHSASDKSVTVGFGQPHAAYHEFGTKHMPRRGLLFEDPGAGTLSQADQQSILELIEGYLSQ